MSLKDPTHQKVFSTIQNKTKGKILDAGAGRGYISLALKKQGFDVTAIDIKPRTTNNLKIKKADLNKKLSFKNSSFDYIIAVEVLEHLENPYHIISEFKRVIKKGGEIYITTPNITNIFSRMKFFLTGTFFAFSPAERKLGHKDPIPFWQITEILKSNGFDIVEISSNQHLKLCGRNDIDVKIKRILANLLYYVSLPFIQPRNVDLLKGDSIFVIAKKR